MLETPVDHGRAVLPERTCAARQPIRGVSVMQMQPFERKGTSELVANQIRKAIVDGTFKPGQQLAEAALSEQLGLGRGTIREALQRLIQEGLVSNHLHRGVFVAVLSDEDIVDVYFARSAAEVAAAQLLTM